MIYLYLRSWHFSKTHFLLSLTFPHVCLLWRKTFLSVKGSPFPVPPSCTHTGRGLRLTQPPSSTSLKTLSPWWWLRSTWWVAGLLTSRRPFRLGKHVTLCSLQTTETPSFTPVNGDKLDMPVGLDYPPEVTLHLCSLPGSAWYTWLQLSSGLWHLHDTC